MLLKLIALLAAVIPLTGPNPAGTWHWPAELSPHAVTPPSFLTAAECHPPAAIPTPPAAIRT